ncbi:hypothetical protein GCM10027452_00550 [Micromonospora halotolerans]
MRRGEQPPWIVSDDLWAEVEPLLPPRPPRRRRYPGRKPLDDRKVLCGVLFVLYTGIPWEYLPQELGFGSGMACWWRLRDWNDAGVWQRLHELLLGKLRAAGQLDMSRAVIDKHHVITDAGGIPLAVSLTGGNRHDVIQLMPLVDKVPRIKGIRGRPRQRPERIYADRGYDYDIYRRQLRGRGHHPGHRPTRRRPRLRPRHPTLGHRADHRPAALVPPATHPLGDPRRHPPSLPHPRLLHRLLAATPTLKELGVLTDDTAVGILNGRGCAGSDVRGGSGDCCGWAEYRRWISVKP